MDTGSLAQGDIVTQHGPVQYDMLLPAHQIPDHRGQGRMFNEGAVVRVPVRINQDLGLLRVSWQPLATNPLVEVGVGGRVEDSIARGCVGSQ